MEQELFRLLAESDDLRLGIRSVGLEDGIEVLIRLSLPGLSLRPAAVRDLMDRLDTLMEKGYRITAQDGWWVVCEKAVARRELGCEESFILRLFADLLGRP